MTLLSCRLLPDVATSPEILCTAAGRRERKLLLFYLLCAEFSFPGPDDSSWSKYEETLAESHEGSEEEESMEVPSTCELEAQSFIECCAEGEIEAGSGFWRLLGIIRGEILPSPWSLPALHQESAWELAGS